MYGSNSHYVQINLNFQQSVQKRLAQIPIEIINRILETLDNFFEMCIKITVKIGSTNNVKAILTENVDEKGLAGKEYICL